MKAAGALRDEICYPFLYETSWLCDFEVATDELCGLIGSALSLLPLAARAKDYVISIVPQPERIELQKGMFKAIGAGVNCDSAFDERSKAAVQDFAARLSLTSGNTELKTCRSP